MGRQHTVKVSGEEMASLRTARDRLFGTDTAPLGEVIDILCDGDEPISEDEEVHDDKPTITDTVVGTHNDNYDGRKRGAYPEGLDPADFLGTIRRFTGKNIQYLRVVGDLDGHAVYEMVNEGGDNYTLNSMPWDEFIEKTARVNPDAPNTPSDDPARTVVRTDFDTQRQRRNEEVKKGCACLPDNEACDNCAGSDHSTIPCGCGDFEVRVPSGKVVPSIDIVCPECGNHFGHSE